MKVTDGVYAYIWNGIFENNCNAFYFGEPLNILFDPGLRNYLDLRFEQMRADGLDPSDIRYIVNTHCHPDHFEASLALKGKIKLAMHEKEIEFLREMGPLFFRMFGLTIQEIPFDEILTEGPWTVNGTELQIIHTPGHSPGSICVYWPEKKALVCGDLVFDQSFGRVDFPGGSAEQLINSIKRVSLLDIEHLLPGHMNLISGKELVQKNFSIVESYFNYIS